MTPNPKQTAAQLRAFARFKNGSIARTARSGTEYRLENIHPTAFGVPCATVRRVIPKARGKAARRAEKTARRAARGGNNSSGI